METCDLLINKDSLLKVLSIANINSESFPTSERYSIQFGRLQRSNNVSGNARDFKPRLVGCLLAAWPRVDEDRAVLQPVCVLVEPHRNPPVETDRARNLVNDW